MRIYIDEAGIFVPPTGGQRSSYSLVLGLIIPSNCEGDLCYEFLRLRDSWPKHEIEIKGSSLDEKRASQVIDLLASFDVVVDFVAIDMALHAKEIVDGFKCRQAEAITAHVTREHHPEMVFETVQLEHRLRSMPNQLFVQAELTIKLILNVLQIATLYFVQRQPAELGDIAWIVDRKGHTLTEMEETWSTLILPMSENHFMKKPLISLKDGDYSHFARYETDPEVDEDMARHLKWVATTYGKDEAAYTGPVIDSKRLLTEQRHFHDSRDSLGLQLADMLASILRRALNNHMQKSGWKDFGKLVIYDPKPGWFSRLGAECAEPSWPQTVIDVWNALQSLSKPMVLDRPPHKTRTVPLTPPVS
jgi:hypothetical protein